MFDIAWSELLLIVVLVLVVMGPKDLPKLMNSIGKMVAKAKRVAREFSGSFQQMAKEAELEDIIKKANRAQTIKPNDVLKNLVDPEGDIDTALNRNTSSKNKPKAAALGDDK
jgi:sec-independent protein translocase protein TatB